MFAVIIGIIIPLLVLDFSLPKFQEESRRDSVKVTLIKWEAREDVSFAYFLLPQDKLHQNSWTQILNKPGNQNKT